MGRSDLPRELTWDVWLLPWLVAMVWSRRTAAQPPALDEIVHWLPTIVGMVLFALTYSQRSPSDYQGIYD
jgi:hypothetical protein